MPVYFCIFVFLFSASKQATVTANMIPVLKVRPGFIYYLTNKATDPYDLSEMAIKRKGPPSMIHWSVGLPDEDL